MSKYKAKEKIAKNCTVCGVEFNSPDDRHITCSSECASLRKSQNASNRHNSYKKKISVKECIICDVEFIPVRPLSQVTCGSSKCTLSLRLNNQRLRKQIVKIKCRYCGVEFFPTNSGTRCGSKECKKRYQQEYYRENYKNAEPRAVSCIDCDVAFIANSASHILCTACALKRKRDSIGRSDERRKTPEYYARLNARLRKLRLDRKVKIKCIHCGVEFIPYGRQVSCKSKECDNAVSRKSHRKRRKVRNMLRSMLESSKIKKQFNQLKETINAE